MTQSIVIFGGAGFLGRRVAEAALARGWSVRSVSRAGRPPVVGAAWHDRVAWLRGDALDPASYADHLRGADHVATTVGVLDYRGVAAAPGPAKAIDRAALTLYDAVRTRLAPAATTMTTTTTTTTDGALERYDRLNRDAAVALAREVARRPSVRSFAYVSTAGNFPGVPARYVESKRAAERAIGEVLRGGDGPPRCLFLRPGFMYATDGGPGDVTRAVARALGLVHALDGASGNRLARLVGAAAVKPLDVARVGSALVEACADERVRGVLPVHRIEALADVRWRREMVV